jgi:hypothetical protein
MPKSVLIGAFVAVTLAIGMDCAGAAETGHQNDAR